jgi:hypothetical protein
MHVKKRNEKTGPKGERKTVCWSKHIYRNQKILEIGSISNPHWRENSALICWLEVHVAKSHSTVGLNLMHCREKGMNPGRKREKNQKLTCVRMLLGKARETKRTIEQQSDTADVFVW